MKKRRNPSLGRRLYIVLAMFSLLLASVLIDVQGYTWTSPAILGLLALFAGFTALSIQIEMRAAEPIIPLVLFN